MQDLSAVSGPIADVNPLASQSPGTLALEDELVEGQMQVYDVFTQRPR